MLILSENIPHLVKYMGSKSEIINYVIKGLNEIHKEEQPVCDLFAGSSTLAGALRNNNIKFISNDIQKYSSIFTKTYLAKYEWDKYPTSEEIIEEAQILVNEWINMFPQHWEKVNYNKEFTLKEFNSLEEFQQKLNEDVEFYNLIKNSDNNDIKNYHLFIKNYSGTYWNYRQCVWIDALRCVADRYIYNDELYNLILSCTMYAMAYNSQSTGHYAQYRKADKESSMDDILIYRRKEIKDFFIKKFDELKDNLTNNNCEVETYDLPFEDCIKKLKNGTLIYADPPYCSVHYSRFYHVLETFVKYDYPVIKYNGRYRTNRHQSPFCISTKVEAAFKLMFTEIMNNKSELVLSYSNSPTNMISLETILLDAFSIFNNITELDDEDIKNKYFNLIEEYIEKEKNIQLKNGFDEIDINVNNIFSKKMLKNINYEISLKMFEHNHSRLGRTNKKYKEVLEILVIVKKIQR